MVKYLVVRMEAEKKSCGESVSTGGIEGQIKSCGESVLGRSRKSHTDAQWHAVAILTVEGGP
ncbi:hypothetical protein ACLOJK_017763 [Asimina triloba]